MFKKIAVASLLCGVMFSSFAEAEMSSKLYVSGTVGYANSGWDFANYDSTGLGFNGTAGYRYNRQWSFEAGFTHFPKSTSGNSTINTNAVSTFARFRLPFEVNKLSFYAKLGLGYLMDSGDSTHSHLGLGIGYGVEYPLMPNLNLLGEYTHYIGNYEPGSQVPNADYYAVGVDYRLPLNVLN
jgi:hypothetical protein